MQAKKGFVLAFSLLLMLGPAMAFYDDFQSYNTISDASFTSNYTLNGAIGGEIAIAPQDSLSVNITASNLFINQTKLNYGYPFNFSYTLRAGSNSLNGHGVYFYINDTNISSARGYKINNSEGVIQLYRFNPSNSVLLNSSTITPFNSSIDNILILSVDANKRIHYYINGQEIMTYYDGAETYLSGGIGIFTAHYVSNNIYIDNINSEIATISDNSYTNPANWNILGWINNIDNFAGFYVSSNHNSGFGSQGNCYYSFKDNDLCVFSCSAGLHQGCSAGNALDIRVQCGHWVCDVQNITYQLAGSPITTTTYGAVGNSYDAYGVPNKYYDAITNYYNVLGQPFTESIRASIHILPYMRLQASAQGCFYVSPSYWYLVGAGINIDASNYIKPIPITSNSDYWGGNDFSHSNTGDYIVSETYGFFCNNSNNLTISYDFYNTQTSALLFTKSEVVPIGYATTFSGTGVGSNASVDYDTPFDCVFNSSYCTGAGALPIVNTSCVGGSCNPAGAGTTQSLITGFDNLGGLLTPMVILLCVVLYFGATITMDTKSNQIGLMVILVGVLILSFYNIVPWYMSILIAIMAGFFIVSEVRNSVFGGSVATG